MTLDEAIYRLGQLAGIVRITGGAPPAGGGISGKRWRVVAAFGAGHCYPPFCEDDDLLTAVLNVIAQWEDRQARGRAFVEANPEFKALPTVTLPKLFPGPNEN